MHITNKIKIASMRGYIISKEGLAFNPKGSEIGVGNRKYKHFSIRINRKTTKIPIHRLQAYQKYGDKLFEKGIEVRHSDGNSLNNSQENILIGTHSQNMMDIPKQVRVRKSLYAASFIRKYNRKKIIEFHASCNSYIATMNEFNITSKGTLHFILNK